jgi:hypothetical protein
MGQYLFYVICSISAFCLGWRMITSEGMILGWLREWCIEHMYHFIAKPFILCITCMASIWGTVIFWCFDACLNIHVDVFTLLEWILCCVVCAFINTFVWQLKVLIEKYINQ